ncbi:MAG: hypothetical protein OXG79_12495 [Chloroflexi bacterium]|nr:hypothetical protein [Chloroflexota bacterium]
MPTLSRAVLPTETLPLDIKDDLGLTEGTTYTLQVTGQAIRIAEAADVDSLPDHWHSVPATRVHSSSVGPPVLFLFPIIVGSDGIWVDLYDRDGPAALISITEAE